MTAITRRQRVVALGRREVQHAQDDAAAQERRRGRREADPDQVHVLEHAMGARAKRLVRLRAHPADHAGLQPGPVVRRARARPPRAARRRPTGALAAPSRRAGIRGCALRSRSSRRPAARDRGRPQAAAAPPRRSGASCLPQLRPQALARPGQTRLDRPDRDAEREADLLVAQAVDLAQHERRLLVERQPVERGTGCVRRAASGRGADRATSRCPAPAGSP